MNERLIFTDELWVQKTHADGRKDPPVLLSKTEVEKPVEPDLNPKKLIGLAVATLTAQWALGEHGLWLLGTITTAGVSYLATDFASAAASPSIGAMKFHDSGTGTTPSTIADTTLETPTGIARATGTPSNPSATQYQSEGSITYDNTYNITEWGLFSAAAAGSIWSHRVFTAQPVVALDALTFRYLLGINAG